MLLTVKEAAHMLSMDIHHVYYLLTMGEIESVKIGRAWRLPPEAVDEYAQRLPEVKNRKPSGYFIYPGDGGFLFGCLLHRLPPDPSSQASGVERQRR
jgi:excisionase family DNA binding protein